MEAATTLRAQMSLIYQILNDLRDLRAAADFRDEIAVNGGLNVQATKIVNFQRAECSTSPWNASSPGMSGSLAWLSGPVLHTKKRALWRAPLASVTSQRPLPSSKRASRMRRPRRRCGSTPKRRAQRCM